MHLRPLDFRFVARSRHRDGLWRDFRTLAGEGIDWPSAFIGLQLALAGWSRAALMRTVRALLDRQHDDGGWGYHAEVPTDADTTACVLLFLTTLGLRDPCVSRAAACLVRHQDPDTGGVRTYERPRPILRYMRLGTHVRLDGWCRPHLDVTAMAGRAFAAVGGDSRPAAEAAWDYVRTRQDEEGCWKAYWWASPHYSTLQAVELALAMGGGPAVQRAAAWTRGLQRRDGSWGQPPSAFATALSLALLAATGGHERSQRHAAERLVAWRDADGGWPSHTEMRIPPPWVRKPECHGPWRVDELGTGVIVHDQNRLFTTAACLGALARSGAAP